LSNQINFIIDKKVNNVCLGLKPDGTTIDKYENTNCVLVYNADNLIMISDDNITRCWH
jgi:uncharacterized protein YdhG (YjbR/CyaY superfamily)